MKIDATNLLLYDLNKSAQTTKQTAKNEASQDKLLKVNEPTKLRTSIDENAIQSTDFSQNNVLADDSTQLILKQISELKKQMSDIKAQIAKLEASKNESASQSAAKKHEANAPFLSAALNEGKKMQAKIDGLLSAGVANQIGAKSGSEGAVMVLPTSNGGERKIKITGENAPDLAGINSQNFELAAFVELDPLIVGSGPQASVNEQINALYSRLDTINARILELNGRLTKQSEPLRLDTSKLIDITG